MSMPDSRKNQADRARDGRSPAGDDRNEKEWCEARPAVIPAPTVWPMVLALAVTISLWGILTSWLFVVVGLLMTVLSIERWIQEMRR